MGKETKKGKPEEVIPEKILAMISAELSKRSDNSLELVKKILKKHPSLLNLKCVSIKIHGVTGIDLSLVFFKNADSKIIKLDLVALDYENSMIQAAINLALSAADGALHRNAKDFVQPTLKLPGKTEILKVDAIHTTLIKYIFFLQKKLPELICFILDEMDTDKTQLDCTALAEHPTTKPLLINPLNTVAIRELMEEGNIETVRKMQRFLPKKYLSETPVQLLMSSEALFIYLNKKLSNNPHIGRQEAKEMLKFVEIQDPPEGYGNLVTLLSIIEKTAPNANHQAILEFLLRDLSIDPNVYEEGYRTALMTYSELGMLERVKLLIQYKADVNVKTPIASIDVPGAIAFALSNLHFEIVKLLVKNGSKLPIYNGVFVISSNGAAAKEVSCGNKYLTTEDMLQTTHGQMLLSVFQDILQEYALKQIELNQEAQRLSKKKVKEKPAKTYKKWKPEPKQKESSKKPADDIEFSSPIKAISSAPAPIDEQPIIELDPKVAAQENKAKFQKLLKHYKTLLKGFNGNGESGSIEDLIKEALFSYLSSESPETFFENTLPALLENHGNPEGINESSKAIALSLGMSDIESVEDFFAALLSDYTLAAKYLRAQSEQNQPPSAAESAGDSWYIDGNLYTSKTVHVFQVSSTTKDEFFIYIPDILWEKHEKLLGKLASKDLKMIAQGSKGEHGLKLLDEKLWELKILGADLRLTANKMYKNSKSNALIILDGDTDHNDVMRLLRSANKIETFYVPDKDENPAVAGDDVPPPSNPAADLEKLLKILLSGLLPDSSESKYTGLIPTGFHDVEADGYCFYHAIADQLVLNGHTPMQSAELHQLAIDYMFNHPNDLVAFLVSDQAPSNVQALAQKGCHNEAVNAYADYQLSTNNIWADGFMVYAMSNALGTIIQVHMFDEHGGLINTVNYHPSTPNPQFTQPLVVGNIANVHFVSHGSPPTQVFPTATDDGAHDTNVTTADLSGSLLPSVLGYLDLGASH